MASLLVVSVHSDAFSDISPLLGHIINSIFGRMVVPFFACVTGYYLTEYSVEKPKMWLKNLKSLLKILCATECYLCSVGCSMPSF